MARMFSKFVAMACAIALLALPATSGARAQSSAIPAPPTSAGPWAEVIRLLDPHTPSAERQQSLASAERKADAGDADWQYVLGSLLAQPPPGSPLPRDPAKALVYLSHAATQGRILAMAQMAEAELAAGNLQEAMAWAQIYGHYQPLQPMGGPAAQGYLAELLARIAVRLGSRPMPSVSDALAAFIQRYDASIRAGLAAPGNSPHGAGLGLPPSGLGQLQSMAASSPDSGFADCLVVFTPDGQPGQVWLLAVEPDNSLAAIARERAQMTHLPPGHAAQRYARLTLMFASDRYRMRSGHVVRGRQ